MPSIHNIHKRKLSCTFNDRVDVEDARLAVHSNMQALVVDLDVLYTCSATVGRGLGPREGRLRREQEKGADQKGDESNTLEEKSMGP
jgi:hypothetical protein